MDRYLQPEFVVFGLTLCGVAIFHRHALAAAIAGVVVTVGFKLATLGLSTGGAWFATLIGHEWNTWINVLTVLLGFAVIANHFERSGLADVLPRLLPRNWTGGLALLGVVFALSIFLDNIAASIIGGIIARHYYRDAVSTAFLAAIVAAANAGGAGSVLGDTTTTMMWISGIPAFDVLPAFVASLAAFAFFAPLAALHQAKRASGCSSAANVTRVSWTRTVVVAVLLVSIIAINALGNALSPALYQTAPWLGVGLWITIGLTALWRKPNWNSVSHALPGAFFLTALVALAAMMPVEGLPPPSWQTVLGLGFLSAVFDNIPLTALALKQGGYDWSLLAYAVGFGGSMMWFGSSAGVALSSDFPQVRSVVGWVRGGWFIPIAYLAGFFVLFFIAGWRAGS
jgi:Na+/H+ antiporter NhaD/arsenite permease-like protein